MILSFNIYETSDTQHIRKRKNDKYYFIKYLFFNNEKIYNIR